jgi:RNA polymerase sigma factor (sigma-70 family)
MVHTVCLRVLGDFHEAQDVTQAVFLTLARKAVSLRKDPSIGGWLHRVALCLARDVRSSRQSRRLREERTAMDRETTTVETSEVDRHALRAELDEALDQLPERYRQALVLFHLEERSLEQTAGALGLKFSAASGGVINYSITATNRSLFFRAKVS